MRDHESLHMLANRPREGSSARLALYVFVIVEAIGLGVAVWQMLGGVASH